MGEQRTRNRRKKIEIMKMRGSLKHFSHFFFFKEMGGVDTTGLGLGHKLIDLFLNQEKAIKIFLASSVGK